MFLMTEIFERISSFYYDSCKRVLNLAQRGEAYDKKSLVGELSTGNST